MNYIGYILAIGAAITWGMVYTLDQKIMDKVSPLSLLFFSYIVSAILLLPAMLFGKDSFQSIFASGKDNISLLFISTVLTVAANLLILNSVKMLNASTSSILEISYPMFVILFSYLLYKNTINWQFAVGAALVLIGTVTIIRYN